MKNIYTYLAGILMVAGFVAFAPSAHAAFNDGSLGYDCQTIGVSVESTSTSDGCDPTYVSTTPGSVINVSFYIHNTNVNAANNVVLRLSPQTTGTVSSQTYSGSITSSNAGSVSGSGTISISSPASLTFLTLEKTDHYGVVTQIPNASALFSGGLNIGTVEGYGTCRVEGGVRDAFCHQQWYVAAFKVSNPVVVTPNPCVISGLTTSTPTVASGAYGTLNWSSSNCSSVSVTGPNGVVSSALNGPVTVGPLTYSINNYNIIGYNSAGTATTGNPVSISVNSVTPSLCTISNFSPSQYQVQSGGTVSLSWTTNNCTSVTVSGSNVSYTTSNLSTVQSGTTYTGAIYGPTTYTISATNGTSTDTRTTSVTATATQNYCTASISAYQTSVPVGSTTTLSWTSSNCNYITISGPNGNLFSGAQSSGTVQSSAINSNPTIFNLVATGTNTVNQSISIYTTGGSTGTVPNVTTQAATGVAGSTATLNGYMNANTGCSYPYYNCNNSYTNYYFQYGTSQYAMNQQTPTQSFGQTSGAVSAYVANLLPNTTYYFQLIGSNSYGLGYGGVQSFYSTGTTTTAISAITSVATNVNANSARLNGVVTANGSVNPVTAHFEYGTSTNLGFRTSTQTVSTNVITNYFDTITTSPNTTYYYRIVGTSNGQVYNGSIVSFTTPAANNGGPVVITRVTGTGGGSTYVSLSIDDSVQTVAPGDLLIYTIKYQNISTVNLSNAILNVILPEGVTFRQASQGVLTTSNTVTATLGTLTPSQEGVITIQAIADTRIIAGNNLVATATLAFTIPNKAQDTAIAYDLDSIMNRNNLAGLALFGDGFWPNSLLGWIILLLLILILVLIARYFYHRGNAQRGNGTPATHVHYGAETNNQHGHGGYPGNNLPH